LGGVQVVVDQALLAATYDQVADLDRAEPVDVERRQETIAEVQVEVGHVLQLAPGVAGTERRQAQGQAPQQVVHNGQVVDGQVPEDIDVVLEQPEVDAHAVDIVEVAQLSGVNQRLDLADGGAVDEGVVDHQGQVLAVGQVDQVHGLTQRGG